MTKVSGSVRGEWPEKAHGERSDKARGKGLTMARGEMLKQVQHDQGGEQQKNILMLYVILNSFQDLSAENGLRRPAENGQTRLAVRC